MKRAQTARVRVRRCGVEESNYWHCRLCARAASGRNSAADDAAAMNFRLTMLIAIIRPQFWLLRKNRRSASGDYGI